MVIFLYHFLMYEIKAFPSAYFDVARNISHGIETDSSLMNGLALVFSFLMIFGGIAFFIAAAIIALPLIITFVMVKTVSEYIVSSK